MESANKYIDLAYLKRLSNGSNEFICQMISVFMIQTPEGLARMEKCVNSKDWKSLHAIAHKMKPSFSFMGIKELEGIVQSIEEYCHTETNLNELPEMIKKVNEVCMHALMELEEEKKLYA